MSKCINRSTYCILKKTISFTPVQQGGGFNQGTNKLYLGWGIGDNDSTHAHVHITVDKTDVGMLTSSHTIGQIEVFNKDFATDSDGIITVDIAKLGVAIKPKLVLAQCNNVNFVYVSYWSESENLTDNVIKLQTLNIVNHTAVASTTINLTMAMFY